MAIKKLHFFLCSIICLIGSSASCQVVYYQETGSGFSIGGSYSARKVSKMTISTISGELSARITKSVSVNVDYTNMLFSSEHYSAFVPSITFQTPGTKQVGFTTNVGYMNSKLSGAVPTLLIGVGIFMRINSESIFQVFPNLSFSHSIQLKRSSYEPDPVVGIGTDFALRLAENAFIVVGPQLLLSGSETQIAGNLGIVIQ